LFNCNSPSGKGLRMSEQGFERYSRQMLFPPIGPEGQSRISKSHVLIVGMGALGTVLANHMVRAGVGLLRMVDRDYVETTNLQRQMLYDEDDVKQALPKVIAAERKLTKVNSDVQIEAEVIDVTAHNVQALLENIDLVLDGTDNFHTRLLLNDACFKKGIPLVYGGAVSSRGMTAIFIPGQTSCLRCLIGSAEGDGQTCDTIGVIGPIVDIVASFQAVEALKYIVGAVKAQSDSLLTLEVWQHQIYSIKLPESKSDCPTCQLKLYPSLDMSENLTATLCGRETVQIKGSKPLDLALWEHRLAPIGLVNLNPFLLKVELPEGEKLVLFADGRVLIQGTEDVTRARSLYDRYIGS
jgi:molybdopterin/thiamine biosynthesis adenylyltransferase